MDEDQTPVPEDLTSDITQLHMTAPRQAPEGALEACLVVLTGPEIGREIKLDRPSLVFGRSLLHCDVQLPASSVSREHACVAVVERAHGRFYEVRDLESRNGTRVNNVPIASARLQNGDKIQMGEVVLKFVLQDVFDARFHEDVHRLIHYDRLTGLLTLDAFRRILETELLRRPEAQPLVVAMTDLDGLKRVNDTYGHLAGRMVVQTMGAIMRETIRPQDHAGLYGGDEAVVLYKDAMLEQAREAAEGLRAAIETREFAYEGASFRVTISQGLAEWPRHGQSVEQLIAAADGALYAAKAAGRNCVCCAGM